jgi:hypothetical protein
MLYGHRRPSVFYIQSKTDFFHVYPV